MTKPDGLILGLDPDAIPPPWPAYELGGFQARFEADPLDLIAAASKMNQTILAHHGQHKEAQEANAFTGLPALQAVFMFAAISEREQGEKIAILQEAVEQLQQQQAAMIAKAAEMGIEL